MRTLVLSASSLDNFQTCMYKGHLSHNLRLRPIGESPDYMETGSMIHKMLEVYYKHQMDSDPVDWQDKREEAITQAVEAGIFMATTILDLDAATIQTNVAVFQEYCGFYAGETWQPIAVEVPFTKILFEDDEFDDGSGVKGLRIAIQGKIDLINMIGKKKIVVDNKTGTRRTEPHPLKNQWRCYCWVADSDLIVVNQIGFQKTVQKFHRPSISFHEDLIQEWKDETINAAIGIHLANVHNNYPRNYAGCDKHFKACEYTPICNSSQATRQNTIDSMYQRYTPSSVYEEVIPSESQRPDSA